VRIFVVSALALCLAS